VDAGRNAVEIMPGREHVDEHHASIPAGGLPVLVRISAARGARCAAFFRPRGTGCYPTAMANATRPKARRRLSTHADPPLRDPVTGTAHRLAPDLNVLLVPEDMAPRSLAMVEERDDGSVLIEYANAAGARSLARRLVSSLGEARQKGATLFLVATGRHDAHGRPVLAPLEAAETRSSSAPAWETLPDRVSSTRQRQAVRVPMPTQILSEREIGAPEKEPLPSGSPSPSPQAADAEPLSVPGADEPQPTRATPSPARGPSPRLAVVEGPVRVRDLIDQVEYDMDSRRYVALVPYGMVRQSRARLVEMTTSGPVIAYVTQNGNHQIARLTAQPLATLAEGDELVLLLATKPGARIEKEPGTFEARVAKVVALPRLPASSVLQIQHVHTGVVITVPPSQVAVAAPSDLRPGAQPALVAVRDQVLEVEYEIPAGGRSRAVLPRRQVTQIDADLILLDRGEHDQQGRHVLSCYRRMGVVAPPVQRAQQSATQVVHDLVTGASIDLTPSLEAIAAPRGMDLGHPAALVQIEKGQVTLEFQTMSGRRERATHALQPLGRLLARGGCALIGSRLRDTEQRLLLHPVCSPGHEPAPMLGPYRPLLAARPAPSSVQRTVYDLVTNRTQEVGGELLVAYAPRDMDVALPASLVGDGRGTVTMEYRTRSGATAQATRFVVAVEGLAHGVVVVNTPERDESGRPLLHAADLRPIGAPPLATSPERPRMASVLEALQAAGRKISPDQDGKEAIEEETPSPDQAPASTRDVQDAGTKDPRPGIVILRPASAGESVEVMSRRLVVIAPEDLLQDVPVVLAIGDGVGTIRYTGTDGAEHGVELPLVELGTVSVGTRIILSTGVPAEMEGFFEALVLDLEVPAAI